MDHADFLLRDSCERTLSYHHRESPRDILRGLSESPAALRAADYFGKGEMLQAFEQRVAKLLGKEAGVFFMKGVVAQHCLLRAVSERQGSRLVGLSPMSHIDFEEGGGLEIIHSLHLVRLGRYAPYTVADLKAVGDTLCAVVVELPLRRAGYLMPTWTELVAISDWCRERGVTLHLDGARIWEAAAGYGREPRDLADLADSVYVSFYKGLGGLAGCLLAGTSATMHAVQGWRVREGGILSTVFPYVIAAANGLDRHLPRMKQYVERARGLALALEGIGTVQLHPRVPQVNAFHIILDGTVADLTARHRDFARQHRVWLFNAFSATAYEGKVMAEIIIGDAADRYSDAEACAWISTFLDTQGNASP